MSFSSVLFAWARSMQISARLLKRSWRIVEDLSAEHDVAGIVVKIIHYIRSSRFILNPGSHNAQLHKYTTMPLSFYISIYFSMYI